MKTRAAILKHCNQPLEIETIQLPAPSDYQVLVRLEYAGICHSQIMEADGKRNNQKFLPHLLGHEGCGWVEAVGKKVKKVTPGDKVILSWIKGSGGDSQGFKIPHHDMIINAGPITTFSNYSLISENRCFIIPKSFPSEIGALFGCCALTGGGIIWHKIKPKPSESLAIFGLGGVGLSALIAAKMLGVTQIFAIDISEDKLALASSITHVTPINASNTSPVEQIKALTDNQGVDYAIEASSKTKIIETSFESLNRTGTCVFASHPPKGEKIKLDPFELISGKKIYGSWGGDAQPDKDIPTLCAHTDYLKDYAQLISHTIALDDINKGFDLVRSNKAKRVMIAFDM